MYMVNISLLSRSGLCTEHTASEYSVNYNTKAVYSFYDLDYLALIIHIIFIYLFLQLPSGMIFARYINSKPVFVKFVRSYNSNI